MNRNLNRRIHPIAEANGLSPKKPRNAKDRVKELDKFQKATAEELIEHFKN